MNLTLRPAGRGAGPVIRAIGPAGLLIGETRFAGAVILTPEAAVAWSVPTILDAQAMAHLADVARACAADVVVIGTGARLVRPAPALIGAIEAFTGVEVMDSHAAARAWTILNVEGRRAVAALLPL